MSPGYLRLRLSALTHSPSVFPPTRYVHMYIHPCVYIRAVRVAQRKAGMPPNTVNHNTVMDALAEAGQRDEALALLKSMKVCV